MIGQVHEIRTLCQQVTLFLRHHTCQTRTLEQIVHQQVYILQRGHLLHLTRRVAVHQLRLDLRRTDKNRHLFHSHRQTYRRRIGQLMHLHRCSRSLRSVETRDERYNSYLLDLHLRYRQTVFRKRQLCRGRHNRRDCFTHRHYCIFLYRSSRSILNNRIIRSTLNIRLFRHIKHGLQIMNLLFHVLVQIRREERIGCHMAV